MQNIGAYGVELKDVFFELEAFHLKDKSVVTFTLADCEFGYRESVFKRKFNKQFVIVTVTYRLSKVPNFKTAYAAIDQELNKMGVSELSIQAISRAIISIRQSKLPNPSEIGNAGSFFKNPVVSKEIHTELLKKYPQLVSYAQPDGSVKLAAGWMIDHCGWKGKSLGAAGVHEKQALVLINRGGASGADVLKLAQAIQEDVRLRFGVTLEIEPVLV